MRQSWVARATRPSRRATGPADLSAVDSNHPGWCMVPRNLASQEAGTPLPLWVGSGKVAAASRRCSAAERTRGGSLEARSAKAESRMRLLANALPAPKIRHPRCRSASRRPEQTPPPPRLRRPGGRLFHPTRAVAVVVVGVVARIAVLCQQPRQVAHPAARRAFFPSLHSPSSLRSRFPIPHGQFIMHQRFGP
jgi:hypothetical protein